MILLSVILQLTDARTFVNLEFVTDLVKYLTNTFSPMESAEAEPVESAGKQNEMPSEDETTPTTNSIIKFTCHLNSTEVILLQDPHLSNTPAIIGRVSDN